MSAWRAEKKFTPSLAACVSEKSGKTFYGRGKECCQVAGFGLPFGWRREFSAQKDMLSVEGHVPKLRCMSAPAENRLALLPKIFSRMNAAGLADIGQITATPVDLLASLLGNQAPAMRQFANGIDERPLMALPIVSAISTDGLLRLAVMSKCPSSMEV
jgi:hypothetical protein